jgi:hypothetical protein
MKRTPFLLLSLLVAGASFAQNVDKIINAKEVERIERTLSADDMQGRATFTPGNDKAAAFIAKEFKKAGIQPWDGKSYIQQLPSMVSGKPESISVTFDGNTIDPNHVAIISGKWDVNVNETSGLEKGTIRKGANFMQEYRRYSMSGKPYLVIIDTSFSSFLVRIRDRASDQSDRLMILVAAPAEPQKFSVKARMKEAKLQNVVGVLPGKSRKNEYVIFSGHYDHLGIRGGKDREGNPVTDSIFNGANDDAAGTTAVIMLAKYYKALNNNERTLIFAAFTGEEVGGFGSHYFSKQYKPEEVMAMFNIEMIGTDSKWGKNSAYITGYERTDMGKILQSNLEGTGFTFYPDPYTTQNLFFRSDNATLALLGVPAHTISTSKMDNEPNYHKASDEIGTLDMDNMAMIIKSIALSARGIISGKETPSRVDVSSLKR